MRIDEITISRRGGEWWGRAVQLGAAPAAVESTDETSYGVYIDLIFKARKDEVIESGIDGS
jgi:hypothetical protein